MKGDTENIGESIRFNTEQEILECWEQPYTKVMRDKSDIRIVEVECILREYN